MGQIGSVFSELLVSLGHDAQAPNGGTAETWLRWLQQEGMTELPPLSRSRLPLLQLRTHVWGQHTVGTLCLPCPLLRLSLLGHRDSLAWPQTCLPPADFTLITGS